MKRRQTVIIERREILMQRLMDGMRHGYTSWTSGAVRVERAAAMIGKFERVYRTGEGRLERERAREHELGNAKLLLLFDRRSPAVIRWWLLISPGDHPARQLERLRDATAPGGRIDVDGFILTRQIRTVSQHPLSKAGTKPSWTWRMSSESDEAWRAAIKAAIRHRQDDKLQQLLERLYRSPGFNAIRKQIGKIRAFTQAEWKRSRSTGEALPDLPEKLGYVRRLKTEGVTLEELKRRLQRPAAGEVQGMDGSEKNPP